MPRLGGVRRLAALVVLVVGLLAASRLPAARGLVERALEGVEALGPWGPLAFIGAYAAATVAMVPGSALTLAAGAAFGPVEGALVASTGATAGAAAAFLIARHLARDAVAGLAARSPLWRALDGAVREGGWKVVALLRLSPAVPFNAQNYLYGLTGLRFWPCVLTSWWAMLPGAFLYASLGAAGREGLAAASGSPRARGPAEWAFLGLGLAATLAVTWRVGRLARNALAVDPRESGGPMTPTDMVRLWDEHLAGEFSTKDVEATLDTMTDDASVDHVPVHAGGSGKAALRVFYRDAFIPSWPDDLRSETTNRVVGADQVVDEIHMTFTHDRPMEWFLPGVPPTHKRVDVHLVVVVQFREGKIARERTYWDQATVLRQVGLLEG